MFINKEEALRRLQSSNNLATSSFNTPRASDSCEVREIDKSRLKQKDLSEEKRTAIAALVIENPRMKQRDIGLLHNISQEEVSKCKTGKIGGRPATAERKNLRSEMLNEAKDVALEKLMAALGLIDEERLSGLESAKDIGRFSKDMASVYNSLVGQGQASGPQVNLIVYAPKSREEGSFKVVDV